MQVATCSDIPRSCGQSLQRLGVIRDRCTLLELVLESSAQYANIHANGKVRSCARARTSSAVSRRHSRRGNMTSRHAKSQVQATVQQVALIGATGISLEKQKASAKVPRQRHM